MRRAYADISTGQLHYREAGEGPPLVLLHMTASSSTMYERVLPLLSGRFRAIALDTPGFGNSDPLPETPTIAAYAAALAEFLDARGLDQVDVVGFHTGASIALELAVSEPARVRRLLLAAILALRDDAERADWSERIVRSWEPDGRGEFLEGILWWLSQYVPADDGEAYLSELTSTLQAGPDYWRAPSAVISYDAFGALARLEHPALFLSPRDDNLVEETRRAQAATPASSYVEVPGNDGAAWQYPAELAAALVAFFDG